MRTEVRELEAVNVLDLRVDVESRERAGRALQLLLERLNVVEVHVRIAHDVDEVTRLEVADLSDHPREQRVGGDVKRHAEAHIAGALIHQAGDLAVGDEELAEHVAGRQGHLLERRRVLG